MDIIPGDIVTIFWCLEKILIHTFRMVDRLTVFLCVKALDNETPQNMAVIADLYGSWCNFWWNTALVPFTGYLNKTWPFIYVSKEDRWVRFAAWLQKTSYDFGLNIFYFKDEKVMIYVREKHISRLCPYIKYKFRPFGNGCDTKITFCLGAPLHASLWQQETSMSVM